jgi:hypothetical protein
MKARLALMLSDRDKLLSQWGIRLLDLIVVSVGK